MLCKRLSGHVANYTSSKNSNGNYITSFKIIENGDYYMELIETVPCSSFDELAKKERHYIESIDCVNNFIPGRKQQEWIQECKQYNENNKERKNVYMKQYRVNNKETIKADKSVKVKCSKCGREVMKVGLSKHRRTIKCQSTADILQELDELIN